MYLYWGGLFSNYFFLSLFSSLSLHLAACYFVTEKNLLLQFTNGKQLS